MLHRFLKLFLVFSLSVVGGGALAEESPERTQDNCDVYTHYDGFQVPKIFDSTICPEDKSILTTIYHFPASMEAAIKLLDLKYKDALLAKVDLRKSLFLDGDSGSNATAETSTVLAESNVAFRNDLANLEQAAIYIQKLALWLTQFLIGFQVLAITFSGLRTGELGGKKYGLFKTFSRVGVGVILISPFPVNSEILGYTTNVMVIQVLIGMGIVAAIGAANIFISTLGFMLISDLPDDRERTYYSTQGDPTGMAMAATKTRALIEDAICAEQSTLLGIYNAANSQGYGSNYSLSKGGSGYQYSTKDDGFNSQIEVLETEDGFTKNVGFNIEQNIRNNPAYVCSNTTVTKPTFLFSSPTVQANLGDRIFNIKDNIDIALLSLTLDSVRSEESVRSLWLGIKATIDNLLHDEVDLEFKESVLTSAANYLFDMLAYKFAGGGLIEQNPEFYDLLNKRAEHAKNFAKLVVAQRCYKDRIAYINTKNTIRSLNSGSAGADEFSLECAVSTNNSLVLPFNADDSSPAAFANDALESFSSTVTAIQDDYVAIYDSYVDYEALLELTRFRVISEITKSLRFGVNDERGSSVNDRVLALREGGFSAFSYNFMGLQDSLNSLFDDLQQYSITYNFVPVEVSTPYYSAASNYLPIGAPDTSGYMWRFKVQPPEFIFVTPKAADASPDYAAVEAAFDAQMFTSQGGSHGSSSGVRSQIGNDFSGGAVEARLGVTKTESLEEKQAAAAQQTINLGFGALWGTGELEEDPEAYYLIVSQCGREDGKEIVLEAYGNEGLKVFDTNCGKYTKHQQFVMREYSSTVLSSGINLLAMYFTAKSANAVSVAMTAIFGSALSSTTDGALEGKQTGKLNKLKKAAKATKEGSKSMARSALDQLGKFGVNPTAQAFATVLGLAGLILTICGAIMGVIVPLIPVMAHILSYLGWLMLTAQLMVIGSLLAMTFFLFTDQNDPNTAPEKSLYGSFINIVFRPVAILIGFVAAYTLTYCAFIILDFTTANIKAGMREVSDFIFDPFKVILNCFMSFVVLGVYVYVVKTIYEIAMKAPNNIIRKMGAESLDAREQKASGLLFAATAKGYDTMLDKGFDKDRSYKQSIDQVIKDNNRAYLDNQREFVSDVGSDIKDKVQPVVDAVKGRMSEHGLFGPPADNNSSDSVASPSGDNHSASKTSTEFGGEAATSNNLDEHVMGTNDSQGPSARAQSKDSTNTVNDVSDKGGPTKSEDGKESDIESDPKERD